VYLAEVAWFYSERFCGSNVVSSAVLSLNTPSSYISHTACINSLAPLHRLGNLPPIRCGPAAKSPKRVITNFLLLMTVLACASAKSRVNMMACQTSFIAFGHPLKDEMEIQQQRELSLETAAERENCIRFSTSCRRGIRKTINSPVNQPLLLRRHVCNI
jgi:hypothetical protein